MMRALRWGANLVWARPLRRERWHPLSKEEQKQVRTFRRRTRTPAPGKRRLRPLSLRWWLGRHPDGSKNWCELRVLTRARLVELRARAIERGYAGRAWKTGSEYLINESAFIWVQGGLELPDGVVICRLIVSQKEFKDYEQRGTAWPTGRILVRRHRLDIHKSDWRRLRRASRRDEKDAYLNLQMALPFNRDEVEPW